MAAKIAATGKREENLMRILITGASGLVGLNLALEAAQANLSGAEQSSPAEHETTTQVSAEGRRVFGVVNSSILKTNAFQVIQADLLVPGQMERLLDEIQPDWVINCAALAIIDACEANPELAYRMNAELPAQLAAYVARGGARLIHLSTDAVFDGQQGNYTEDDEPNPLSLYARTKLEGERRVAEANPEAVIARINLFGWSLSGKRSLAEWFFYNLQAGKNVRGFTDVYFCPLLVNDLAKILLKILRLRLKGLYHVVSSQCSSKYDFGVGLAERFQFDAGLIRPSSVIEAGLAAVRSPNLTLKSDKIARALGEPLPNLSTALDRFYDLYQQGYPQSLRDLGVSKSLESQF
jgi:dTDP-4-dehydrorhamnose reductase